MQTNQNKGADKFQSAAKLGNRRNNGINTFCGKEIDSTLDKKDVMSAKFSALNHLNDIMGFDTHNSNGYIIRLIVDKGERARLLDEINICQNLPKECFENGCIDEGLRLNGVICWNTMDNTLLSKQTNNKMNKDYNTTMVASEQMSNETVTSNNTKRMMNDTTKSAGVSHPAANMANLGNEGINTLTVNTTKKNTGKVRKSSQKLKPTVASLVTKALAPDVKIRRYANGKYCACYNWVDGKFVISNYEELLEVAHQLCDIMHHHAVELTEKEGLTNPEDVLFVPYFNKHVHLYGTMDFKISVREEYNGNNYDLKKLKIHHFYEGVICYGGIHLADWLIKPTGQRFSNIVGCLMLVELRSIAENLKVEIDSEEVYNASTYARAHWSSYEEMQKFIAIREANSIANGGQTCWMFAAREVHGQSFNHEMIA